MEILTLGVGRVVVQYHTRVPWYGTRVLILVLQYPVLWPKLWHAATHSSSTAAQPAKTAAGPAVDVVGRGETLSVKSRPGRSHARLCRFLFDGTFLPGGLACCRLDCADDDDDDDGQLRHGDGVNASTMGSCTSSPSDVVVTSAHNGGAVTSYTTAKATTQVDSQLQASGPQPNKFCGTPGYDENQRVNTSAVFFADFDQTFVKAHTFKVRACQWCGDMRARVCVCMCGMHAAAVAAKCFPAHPECPPA